MSTKPSAEQVVWKSGTGVETTVQAEITSSKAIESSLLSRVSALETINLSATTPGFTPVLVATTADITLSGLLTIDSVVLVAGDRVLVKNQATASQNGIYVAASGAWTRARDLDETAEFVSGRTVIVRAGTVNAQFRFILASTGTVGTTAMTWTDVVRDVKATSISASTVSVGTNLTAPAASVTTLAVQTFNCSNDAGLIGHFARQTPPNGWLVANGQAVSRTTYAALFDAIGTFWGAGNGSTTFNVPDLRGEFIRGWDNARGVDAGRIFGSAQTDAIKSHSHLINYNGAHGSNSQNRANDPRWTWGDVEHTNTANNATTLATGGVETRPRNISLLACIKY